MQYGRMQKKIEDTCEEIRQLKAMKEAYDEYDLLREKWKNTAGLLRD